ncbi:MAG: response regulator [Terriglobales bacterium]
MNKVLIVDDSLAQTRLIRSVLEQAGFQTVTSSDSREVEEILAVERPQLILLDVIMPGRNGFQVCRELKSSAEYARIPVVLVTSKTAESDRFWGEQQGADGYVTKPFTKEELLEQVRKFVRN